MQKIKYLNILCAQNARIDELFNTRGLSPKTYERMNHTLSMCGHLLDELQYPTESIEYFERCLAELVSEVDALFAFMPTIVHYRGITAEICKGENDYSCKVTDRHGNDLRWYINAGSMPQAIAKAERYFDNAIACLRGFCTSDEFYGRMHGYCV
jgi:hypothetical protein